MKVVSLKNLARAIPTTGIVGDIPSLFQTSYMPYECVINNNSFNHSCATYASTPRYQRGVGDVVSSGLLSRSQILLQSSRPAYHSSSKDRPTRKERMKRQMHLEDSVKSRIANFPHRSLLKTAAAVTDEEISNSAVFLEKVNNLKKMAGNGQCMSFSGPKSHWSSRIVIIQSSPSEDCYETWVNPVISGCVSGGEVNKDDKYVTPMYGMWENCVSCGVCHAWVLRPQCVRVTGQDEYGNTKTEVMSGIRARMILHEMDHLEGRSILQQAQGPDFIVSMQALSQKELWPGGFPSIEANVTGPMQFFDYVANEPIIPPGFEWFFAKGGMGQYSTFNNPQLNQ